MTKSDIRNNKLQELCRGYLLKLRPLAAKFGLGGFVDNTIKANLRNECAGTEEEVELLSRACDDERIADYYASASKEMQELMEQSALVIIDFDKAIELGFVQLNEKMRHLYEQELDRA